jgi:hypothetical protein
MKPIVDEIERFLALHAGIVKNVTTLTRYNHQHACPPGDGLLTCITVYAEFVNSAIFGSRGPFLSEVYPRYRFLRRRLTEFLVDEELLLKGPDSTLTVSVVPTASTDSKLGPTLPLDTSSSRGALILPIDELTKRSRYYLQLANLYDIEYCLLTNKKTVVGPDAGILTTACVAAQTFKNKIRVIEFGTGAGTTPLILSRLKKLGAYMGNDFSPEVVDFFNMTIRPGLTRAGIDCRLHHGSCFELTIEDPVDLIIVGVFYQAQPDFVKFKGRAVSAALGENGVLIIQSGKPENPFVTNLLTEDPDRHAAWPWYGEEYYLNHYFRYVAKTDVHDETMLIASNNSARIEHIDALLQQERLAEVQQFGAVSRIVG